MRRSAIVVIIILLANIHTLLGQQNSTLFFMHSTPQANIVNPAVQNDCNWIIGLPILSSVHLNYGNSAFTFHQIFKKQADGTYLFSGDDIITKLARTNFISTEFHTNLFYLGFWRKDNFITFSINEKADMMLTFPSDFLSLGLKGNTQFEGRYAELSRTGIFLNYRREFAVGLARQTASDLTWGIRAKLLFGKLNTSMNNASTTLFTQPNTFDLTMASNWELNTYLPLIVQKNPDNTISSISSNGSIGGILLNRKNIGLAFDLGFIKYRDDKITISGSILDLGLIYWANNNTFSQNGSYSYHGPLGDTINSNNYFDDLMRVVKNEFGIVSKQKSYLTFLSPMIYLGGTYAIKEDLNAGILLSSKVTRYKISSGITFSLNKTFNEKSSASISYSYIYRDFKNLGAGVKLGKSPLQFYAVSDNILGFIKPLDTRNINLRFGLQINFSCNRKETIKGCGCTWIRTAEERRIRNNRLLRKK
jgi:hypothetical protein